MTEARLPVVVLAGGKSTRFGSDKASYVLAGRPLLQHVVDATAELASRFVVVMAEGQALPKLEATVACEEVEDVFPQSGPLGGIFTGLQHLYPGRGEGSRRALVVACDMPLLRAELLRVVLRQLEGQNAAVPLRDGLPEPLCGVYTAACIKPARRLLDRGEFKVSGLLEKVNTVFVPEEQWRPRDRDGRSFLNVNRPEDLEVVASTLTTPPGASRD